MISLQSLITPSFGEALSTASSWAGGKVEGMVAEVATSESEAQRFMKALKTCAGTAGVVVGVKIATKSLKASKIQPPTIKDALSERPIIKDGKVWLGDKELGEAALLELEKMHDHHIFPQKYKLFFDKAGINIDEYCISLPKTIHLKGVHGAGKLNRMPGKWNQEWERFIQAKPQATQKDIFQFGGYLVDQFGLDKGVIHGYKK